MERERESQLFFDSGSFLPPPSLSHLVHSVCPRSVDSASYGIVDDGPAHHQAHELVGL
jgi:hypothetical protein